MPAIHATNPLDADPGAPPPRAPWRAIALLTAVVAAAHVLLLGLAPSGIDLTAADTGNHFTTRTIELPPPAAPPSPPPDMTAPANPVDTVSKPVAAKRPAPVRHEPSKPAARVAPGPPAPAEAPVATAAARAPDTDAQPTTPEVASAAPSTEATGGTEGGFGSVEASGSQGAGPLGNGDAGVAVTGAVAGADAGAVTPPAPARVPGSIRLTFLVTAQRGPQPLSGAFGELVWKQEGDRYEAQLSAKLLMFVLTRWTSSGSIGPNGILPDRYADTRKTPVATHFVRDRGEIVFSNNSPAAPLLPGAQDRLSVLMQLGGVLSAAPNRYPAGSKVSVQTASTKEADVWVFNVGGDEVLQLPAGEVHAVKLTRLPRRPNDQKVELWLSRDHDYLPARLVLTDPDGNWADFQMRELVPPAAGR